MLAREVAGHYGVEPVLEVITATLDGFGCYPRRDEAIERVFPEYDAASGYKAKIVLPQNLLDEDTLNLFYLTIVTPDGEEKNQTPAPEGIFPDCGGLELQTTCPDVDAVLSRRTTQLRRDRHSEQERT